MPALLSLRARKGRGNPVGVVTWDAVAMRWVAGWFRWIAASLRSSQ